MYKQVLCNPLFEVSAEGVVRSKRHPGRKIKIDKYGCVRLLGRRHYVIDLAEDAFGFYDGPDWPSRAPKRRTPGWRISEKKRAEIERELEKGVAQKVLADQYGVSPPAIHYIKRSLDRKKRIAHNNRKLDPTMCVLLAARHKEGVTLECLAQEFEMTLEAMSASIAYGRSITPKTHWRPRRLRKALRENLP